MSFLGKEYTFDKQENFEEFVKSLDVTPEQAQGFLNYHPNQKLVKDGDSYTLVTTTPVTKNELTFKLGVPFEEKVADRICKTTYTLEGNVLKQEQKFEDGVVFNFNREYSDTQLVVTIACTKFDGTARRYYKA